MASLPPLPDEPVILPATWNEIWKMALTRPTVETFTALAHAQSVSSNRAHQWVLISAVVGSILAGAVSTFFSILLGGQTSTGPSQLDLLLLAPFIGLVALVLFMISVGIGLLCAHALGGKGIYPRLAYAMATFVSPLLVIGSILSAIPLLNVTNGLIVLYGAWLSIVAVRAITHLTWPKALLTLALTIGALFLLLAGFIVVTLPLFANAFQGAPK